MYKRQLDKFQEFDFRKSYIKNLISIDSLKPFLEEKGLTDFLNDKLKEEKSVTLTPSPIEDKPQETIIDLEVEIDLLKLEMCIRDRIKIVEI